MRIASQPKTVSIGDLDQRLTIVEKQAAIRFNDRPFECWQDYTPEQAIGMLRESELIICRSARADDSMQLFRTLSI
jgi:hypothetical protein